MIIHRRVSENAEFCPYWHLATKELMPFVVFAT